MSSGVWSYRMPNLYLSDQGSSLHINGERLVVKKDQQVVLDIPFFHIERVMLYGNIQVTTQAIQYMLKNSVPCSFFSQNCKYHGSLQSFYSGNVFLRICQFERYLDMNFRIWISKTLISNKINKQISLLNQTKKSFSNQISSTLIKLNELQSAIETAETISEIMGYEGKSSASYFSCFNEILCSDFVFSERNRRPPRDPVNALLSLSYTMLTNELFSLLLGSGLDPYIGFLHDLSYNRPSLALDFIEEYRCSVDKFVLKILNLNQMVKVDFETMENKVLLTDEGRKKFFTLYESFLKENCLRQIMKKQLEKMYKTIQNMEEYTPYGET